MCGVLDTLLKPDLPKRRRKERKSVCTFLIRTLYFLKYKNFFFSTHYQSVQHVFIPIFHIWKCFTPYTTIKFTIFIISFHDLSRVVWIPHALCNLRKHADINILTCFLFINRYTTIHTTMIINTMFHTK